MLALTREYIYLHGQMVSVIDTLPPTTEATQTAIKTKPALEKTNTQLEADNSTNTSVRSGGGFEFIVFIAMALFIGLRTKILSFTVFINKTRTLAVSLCTVFMAGCVGEPETSSTMCFVHIDHLGSPTIITDDQETPAVVWEARREPFGETVVVTEEISFDVRFPGQYYDKENGLHYNYFRDYDPSTGRYLRYLQSDPIGLAGGLNTYGYAYQNPIMNFDPDGRLVWFGIPAAYWAAGAIATARAYVADQWAANNMNSKQPDVPYHGPPGEWIDGKRRSRKYGPDGLPEIDLDKPHQGYPGEHVHEWPDGEREHPGRDVCILPPCDPPPEPEDCE